MKYILWDFDGTLGYREGAWSGTLMEVIRREFPDSDLSLSDFDPHLQSGFPWQHHDRVRSAGQHADEWWAELEPVFESALMRAAGLSANEARRLSRNVRDVYLDLSFWHLFDDTVECLSDLQAAGWKQVIVSNHVPELPMIVNHLGLSPFFNEVYNSATLGVEKPHPMIFQKVLSDLAPYREVWMIGDNPIADIGGAEAVGIHAILVRSENPGVKRYAKSLKHVPQLLVDPQPFPEEGA